MLGWDTYTDSSNMKRVIIQLGTTNWQRMEEPKDPATGSGTFHENVHNALNKLEGVRCYSVFPSSVQTEPPGDPNRPDVKVVHLPHPLPICEGIGPLSKLRWHSMTDAQIEEYRARFEPMIYDWMEKIEKENGIQFTLAIAHHTFLSPVMLQAVLKKRVANGKARIPLAVFCHGTGLKMYENELSKDEEWKDYDVRFHPWIKDNLKLFNDYGNDGDGCKCVYTVSTKQKEVMEQVFPEFPQDRVVVQGCGINTEVFNPRLEEVPTLADALKRYKTEPYEGSGRQPSEIPAGYKNCVVFAGRFADWKRLDVLLMAAKIYEQKLPNCCTVMIGTAQLDLQKKYQDIATDLKLEHTYFIGAKPQKDLAIMFSWADVSCFPSKDEPFGQVFIESMACGSPVIGANSGGPRDFVSADNGELIPESDDPQTLANSLADAICRAVTENWKTSKKDGILKTAGKYTVLAQVEGLMGHTDRVLGQ